MKKFDLPVGVYAITDSKSGKNKPFLEYCEDLLKGGAKIIQYREKNKDFKSLLKEARALKELTLKYNALFIVNDYLDVALLSEADGIHIGQDDLPIKEVREILGDNKIVGISTHSPKEAQQALIDGADYIGVGPIFYTETKENVCSPVTLKYLDFVNKNINLPYVAIGGIKESNMHEVLATGAKSICLVSELVGAENTFETTKRVNNIIQNWHKTD